MHALTSGNLRISLWRSRIKARVLNYPKKDTELNAIIRWQVSIFMKFKQNDCQNNFTEM